MGKLLGFRFKNFSSFEMKHYLIDLISKAQLSGFLVKSNNQITIIKPIFAPKPNNNVFMSTAIVLGSARSNGNTKKICDQMLQFKEAAFYDLNDFNIGYYSYSNEHIDDDFFSLMEQLIEVDTLVLATPVYWYAMSAQLKTFLDRFTDLLKVRKELGRKLRGKNLIVVCCSSDEEEFPEFWKPFERTAAYLGMHYRGQAHTWIVEDKIPEAVKNKLKKLFS